MAQLTTRFDNRILSSLPLDELGLIEPHLRNFELVQGDRLQRSGDPAEYVYFPHAGVISLAVALADGNAIKVAMIGREGALIDGGTLTIKHAMVDATIPVPGKASRMDISQFGQAMSQCPTLRHLVARHDSMMAAQAQQSAACNARHSAEARICRCVLEISDRIDAETVPLTQSVLADMLGVQRTTITTAARTLQAAGAFECRRGTIRIHSRALLEQAVCECYGRLRHLRTQLFPDASFTGTASRPSLQRQQPLPASQ